jgi:hypothetical protein
MNRSCRTCGDFLKQLGIPATEMEALQQGKVKFERWHKGPEDTDEEDN